jgi:hypothetical protein
LILVKTQDRENQIPLKIFPPIWKKITEFASHKKTHLYGRLQFLTAFLVAQGDGGIKTIL